MKKVLKTIFFYLIYEHNDINLLWKYNWFEKNNYKNISFNWNFDEFYLKDIS